MANNVASDVNFNESNVVPLLILAESVVPEVDQPSKSYPFLVGSFISPTDRFVPPLYHTTGMTSPVADLYASATLVLRPFIVKELHDIVGFPPL